MKSLEARRQQSANYFIKACWDVERKRSKNTFPESAPVELFPKNRATQKTSYDVPEAKLNVGFSNCLYLKKKTVLLLVCVTVKRYHIVCYLHPGVTRITHLSASASAQLL